MSSPKNKPLGGRTEMVLFIYFHISLVKDCQLGVSPVNYSDSDSYLSILRLTFLYQERYRDYLSRNEFDNFRADQAFYFNFCFPCESHFVNARGYLCLKSSTWSVQGNLGTPRLRRLDPFFRFTTNHPTAPHDTPRHPTAPHDTPRHPTTPHGTPRHESLWSCTIKKVF